MKRNEPVRQYQRCYEWANQNILDLLQVGVATHALCHWKLEPQLILYGSCILTPIREVHKKKPNRSHRIGLNWEYRQSRWSPSCELSSLARMTRPWHLESWNPSNLHGFVPALELVELQLDVAAKCRQLPSSRANTLRRNIGALSGG